MSLAVGSSAAKHRVKDEGEVLQDLPLERLPHPDLVVRARKLGLLREALRRKVPPDGEPGEEILKLGKLGRIARWRVTLLRPPTWWEAFYTFTQESTWHGVRFIFDVDNFGPRRLLWLMTWFSMLYLWAITTNAVVQDVTANPTIDVREIQTLEALRFPAVTLCNQNQFRLSQAARGGLYGPLERLFENLTSLSLSDVQTLQFGNATEIIASLAHQEEDLIFACSWEGRPCPPHSFQRVCYTFNWEPMWPLETRTPGETFGLSLVLNLEQYEYMAGPQDSAAVHVILQSGRELPGPELPGIDVPPGYRASVGLSETRISSESGDGSEDLCKPPPLRYFPMSRWEYTVSACQWECQADYVRLACLCQQLQVPFPRGLNASLLPVCSLYDKYGCVDQAVATLKENGTDFHCESACPPTCDSVTFNPQLSYSALSRYNAEKILEERAERIALIRKQFETAREFSARLNLQEVAEDETSFQQIDATLGALQLMNIEQNDKAMNTLSSELLNISCFANARRIVREYEAFTSLGLKKLASVNVFTANRSLFLRTHRHQIARIGADMGALPELLLRRLTPWTASIAKGLADIVDDNARLGKVLLENMARDVAERVVALELLVVEHPYLRTIPSFESRFSRLGELRGSLTACYGRLSRMVDDVGFALADQILAGSVDATFLRDKTATLKPQVTLCQSILVSNFSFDREFWKADYDRELGAIAKDTETIFAHLNKLETAISVPDVFIPSPVELRRDFFVGNRRYRTQLITKLELAQGVTADGFKDKVNSFVNFLNAVSRYLVGTEAELSAYLTEFGGLNERLAPVLRALEKARDPDDFPLFFKGELYNATEVEECTMNGTRSFVSERQTALQTQQRRFLIFWRRLLQDLERYARSATLDADFVLSNFAELSVHFRSMRLENIQKQPQFTPEGLFAKLGGSAGLYFGASFITLVEVLDFVVYAAYRKWVYGRRREAQERAFTHASFFASHALAHARRMTNGLFWKWQCKRKITGRGKTKYGKVSQM